MDLISQLMDGAAQRASALGRPLVTLSYAQSLDGSLSAQRGRGLAISCPESKLLTHRLRAANTAILVGIGTVLADDPRLSARLAGGPHPQPVVLDRLLRIPDEARLLGRKDLPPWVFCGPEASQERLLALKARGVQAVRVCQGEDSNLDLGEVLLRLGQAGYFSLMVEGGGRVITSFLRERLVDQAMLTLAPVWIGGMASLNHATSGNETYPALRDAHYEKVGRDLVIWGKVGEDSYESSGPVFYGPRTG